MAVKKELYANGLAVDLPEDFVVAITFQDYNPLSPNTIKFTYSAKVKIPVTVNNDKVFGLIRNPNSKGTFHKAKVPIRYIQGGIEIIPDGYLTVYSANSSYYECALFSYGVDLFPLLRDRTLNDLDYTANNRSWLASDMNALSNVIAPVMAPYIDYGNNINLGTNLVTQGTSDNYAPCFNYKTIIDRIFSSAGYTVNYGTLGSNAKFLAAIITAGLENGIRSYPDKYQKTFEFTGENTSSATQNGTVIGNAWNVQFPYQAIQNKFWDGNTCNVVNPDTASITAWVELTLTGFITSSAASFDVRIVNYNGSVVLATQSSVAGACLFNLKVVTTWKNADSFAFQLYQTANGATTFTIWANIKCSCKFNNAYPSGYIYFNQWMPTVSQLTFVKDFLFRFGQIPKQSSKTITFKALKDILSDVAGAIDFGPYRVKEMPESIGFDMSSYIAQVTRYQYDSLDASIGVGYGEGTLSVNNLNLPIEKVYTSFFSNTDSNNPNGIVCAKIPMSSPMGKLGSRILLARANNNVFEPAAKWDTLYNTNYKVAAFVNGGFGWSYADIIAEWYSDFFNRIKDAGIVTRYYAFRDAKFIPDPHKMIYEDGSHFLFPVIQNYLPNKVAKVTMLKI